jgi:hypothetical protein
VTEDTGMMNFTGTGLFLARVGLAHEDGLDRASLRPGPELVLVSLPVEHASTL